MATKTAAEETWWESAARNAWGRYISAIEEECLLRALAAFDRPGQALEIGCEGGRWSMLMAERGWSVACTDVDDQMLAVCRRRIPEAECILVDPTSDRLPVGNASQNLILCMEVPPVVQSSWFPAEAARALRPGGLLVFTYFNPRSLRAAAYKAAGRLIPGKKDYGTYNALPWSGYRATLAGRGFEIVSQTGLCWFPFSRRSDSPLIAPCVRLEKLLGLRRLASVSPWIVAIARKH